MIYYLVNTTCPFKVVGQEKSQYMVEVAIWIM